MKTSQHQEELFRDHPLATNAVDISPEIGLDKELLINWQQKVNNYQKNLFKNSIRNNLQISFLNLDSNTSSNHLNPLTLKPLPLNFWKWPNCPHKGPAIYWVIDRTPKLQSNILLYIGETIASEKRWKGEHDCKSYLSAYCEALSIARMESQLSIRFWADVPKDTRSRRNLEQQLIRLWLPPFNKETRSRWNTPFTADIL